MRVHPGLASRCRASRLALGVLRMGLAAVFASLGLGFLAVPRLTTGLPGFGDGPTYMLLLGVSHLAVGIALLSPALGAGMPFLVGSLVI